MFEMERPPPGGKRASLPEVDRAAGYDLAAASSLSILSFNTLNGENISCTKLITPS
jgi:predicted NUDIX family NTP pyrophosphohydrolase